MPTVRFFTNLDPALAQLITQNAPENYIVTTHSAKLPDQEKTTLLHDADFAILFPSVLADEVIRAAPKLKLIQLVSAGFDSIDVALCRELGIPVANNGGTNSIDVAEHTLTLILAFYRHLIAMDHNTRNDGWRDLDSGQITYTINGKTAGLVGLGNIGQKTARLLKAFGAEVLFYDPFPPADSIIQELGAKQCTLEEMLPQSDIVSLHVPLNDATRGIISTEQLAMMQSTALLVNTCRGPVVDESALVTALQTGGIAGAALDVLEQEPPDPANPLFQMENVLLTPHIAGVTRDTWARRGKFIFENLQRVWAGEGPLAVVN